MKTFSTVEDYIEVIAGWRDPVTNTTPGNHNALWFCFNPIVSLARYDVSVLDSMCTAALENRALTTKQGELAVKILLKYKRQFAQKDIDVSPLETPKWRLPLRTMDYSRRMSIQDDKIRIEFPFKTDLIEGLREFRKDSQGHGEWNKDKKRWEFALTEYNLEYLKTWCEANEFEIDAETNRLHAIVDAVEKTLYAIELDFADGGLAIKNAAESLIEYINTNCGGFDYENLPRLIDMADILGYTVSPGIAEAWRQEHGNAIDNFTRLRELKVDATKYSTQEILSSVVKYADLTNRYPIVFFEPDMSGRLYKELYDIVGADNIKTHRGRHSIGKMDSGVKYVYTSVPIKDFAIPLLVSNAGMMFGGDKSLMVQNTEKAVYIAAEVYTSKRDHKVAEFGSETSNT